MPTNQPGDSAAANTNDQYPSTVIAPKPSAIDDDGAYGYDVAPKPDFVRADDDNFTGA